MISCHQAVAQLWEYLDQTLVTADRARVDEHLARCRRCCGEMEFAHELRSVLATGIDVDMPSEVRDRLHQILEELDR